MMPRTICLPADGRTAVERRTALEAGVAAAFRSDTAKVKLAGLEKPGGWRSRAEIIEAVSTDARAWNAAIAELLAAGDVGRQGEKRGTRYRRVGG